MEKTWSVKINSETHVVKASLSALWNLLTIYLNGDLVHKRRVLFAYGVLCQIQALGHELTIKIEGYGTLGELYLLIDGVDAAIFNSNASADIQSTGTFQDINLVETQRVEEPLGEELREIDNSSSEAEITRRITVSREWTQSCVLERENRLSGEGQLGIQGAWLVTAKATIEGVIRRRYQISVDEKRIYAEELTIKVPARTKVKVVLRWKQVWQCGVALVYPAKGVEVKVPFKVCLGPTFDQRQFE